jgi:glycosyltransferase involved in cell wall biosynthesis
MRVLHVVATRQRRGAELFASSLVGALGSDEVDQRVVVLRSNGGEGVSFAAPVTTFDGQVRSVPGIRVDLARVNGLHRVVRAFRPDVVQAHGGESLKYALAALRGDGRRIAYRRIGDAVRFEGGRVRERAHVALMRRASRVIAVADILRDELVRRHHIDPSRVVTIPNGVDLESIVPSRSRPEIRSELGIPADARVILSLGALTWEKDPVGHLAVVAQAAGDRPHVVHLIAGDGPLRDRVEAEVRRLRLQERARLLGPRDDVADLLAASDVVLLASRTEGMPASLIEAGLAGLPVAAFAISGVPEVVVHGETGVLAPPGDVDALARALAGLLDDDDRRRAMGRAAAERCRERFDIRVVAPKYLGVYEEIARAA